MLSTFSTTLTLFVMRLVPGDGIQNGICMGTFSRSCASEKRRRPCNSTMITKGERYREIVAVLARHGIGLVDDEFIKHEAGEQARAEHLRHACEELGTMFIKLGQALSTRGDVLPDAYRNELAKLQDEVVPVPANIIVDVIHEDLG